MNTPVSSDASLTTRFWTNLKAVRLSAVAWVILFGAIAKFALHTFTGAQYGFYVDELYTIALSKHLAWGYVDLPPLAPALCALSRLLFGESIAAVHFLPAVAGALTLVFACLITREFGGKVFAVALTGVGFLACSAWMVMDSYFTYNAFDQLALSAFLYVLVRFLRSGNRRLWIWLGVIAGFACLTKMTLLYLGPGFLAALLLTGHRRDLRTRWPWLGAALCLLIVSPYLLWQVDNGWPTVRYWLAYGTQRLYRAPLGDYLLSLIWELNPVLLPLFLLGLWRLFRRLGETKFIFLAVMFLASLVLLFFLRARSWMLAAMFLPLISAGAVAVEEMTGGKRWRAIPRASAAALILAGGVMVAPVNLPLVPLDSLPAFAQKYPLFSVQFRTFTFQDSDYPMILALHTGWEEMAQKVAAVYNSLPAEDRHAAGIYTSWYGPAAAIDYYAQKYGLPHAVSGHLNYYLWGPGYTWDVMIVLTNANFQSPLAQFAICQMKGRIYNQFTLPVNQMTIYICRKPYLKAGELWKQMEFYQ